MKQIFLQVSEFMDSVILSWMSVWYVKVFIDLISTETVAIRNMVTSVGGALLTLLLLKYYEDKVPIVVVLIAIAVSYTALVALLIGPNEFILLTSILGIGVGCTCRMMMNNIYAKNIPQEERAKFDNYRELSSSLGNIIGGALACVSILAWVNYQVMWPLIYLALDINMIAIIWAIKKKWLEY